MNKKKLSFLLSLTLMLSVFVPFNSVSAASTNVNINNVPVIFNDNSGSPFVDDANRTQVPLRVTMESYGCQVNWNSATKTATIQKDGKTVEVPIGEQYIIVDGNIKSNDTAAVIRYNRTYLPIRAVLEAFGAKVGWNQATQTVEVTAPGFNPPATVQPQPTPATTSSKYVGNSRTSLFHLSTCEKVQYINPYNKVEFSSASQALAQGYESCYYCHPASAGSSAITQPTVPSTVTPAPSQTVTSMVWIPRTGTKYHTRSTCSNMKNPSQISKDTAVQRGYAPCKKCC
ncbi:MAG: copper amine oxidase N-terminal domain-containing protein [Firmicutes bacterium]|nr:copper amine oxidase N-terminal domain-containing protein [Bacillota bacterium]